MTALADPGNDDSAAHLRTEVERRAECAIKGPGKLLEPLYFGLDDPTSDGEILRQAAGGGSIALMVAGVPGPQLS
jgi:hypothetical protein